MDFIKEACVESLEEAIQAEKLGANRIELCAHLEEDGLTPDKGLITKVQNKLAIPIRVMVRPRAGNFLYNDSELEHMKASIDFCKKTGVDGIVLGVLNQDKSIDTVVLQELIVRARPLKIVFHKAIDQTPDILNATKILMKFGVDTILSSGTQKTAFEGEEILKKMLNIAKKDIEIMPAGKITHKNIYRLHKKIRAGAYHGRKIMGPYKPQSPYH